MRTFFNFALVGVAAASYGRSQDRNYGTTGHYGNQFAHKGIDDHDHADHIYGYDSVAPNKYLKTTAGLNENNTKLTAILTEVENANTARIDYLQFIRERRDQRLLEIKT